jgi:uncharacterized protein DUF1232
MVTRRGVSGDFGVPSSPKSVRGCHIARVARHPRHPSDGTWVSDFAAVGYSLSWETGEVMRTELWVVVAVAAALIVTTVVLAGMLLVRLVRARRRLRDAGIPVENKMIFWGALIYLASPVDLLPDPVLLDDIGFLLLAVRSLQSAADRAGVAPRR